MIPLDDSENGPIYSQQKRESHLWGSLFLSTCETYWWWNTLRMSPMKENDAHILLTEIQDVNQHIFEDDHEIVEGDELH